MFDIFSRAGPFLSVRWSLRGGGGSCAVSLSSTGCLNPN